MPYYHHSLDPVAFEIFSYQVRWYSLVYVLGFILTSIYIKSIVKRKKLNFNLAYLEDFMSYGMLGVIIGARLVYVIFYDISYYLSTWDLLEVFRVDHGGLSFHGGVLGGGIFIYLFCKKYKIDFWFMTDLVCINLPIFLFLGRIANFINGELYGRPTSMPWGVVFDDNIVRHPSQIYEGITEGLLIGIVLHAIAWKLNKNSATDKKNSVQDVVQAQSSDIYTNQISSNTIVKYNVNGKITIYFILLYSIVRFINEFFRESEVYFDILTMGQILSLASIIFIYKIYEKNSFQ